MKEEYAQLLQLTRVAIEQQYPKGTLFEAALKWKPSAVQKQEVHEEIKPPPPRPLSQPVKPKPLPPPSPPKEIPKAQEIKRSQSIAKAEEGSSEMLSLLKELVPELRLAPPPSIFADLCFLAEQEEAPLYEKIVSALEKRNIKACFVLIDNFTQALLLNPFKALIISKKLLTERAILHPHAKRDANKRIYLGEIPILLAPSTQDLESEEHKRVFWNKLLQAASS